MGGQPYKRTVAQKNYDYQHARIFEEEVGRYLGEFKISQLTSSTKMDWYVPGFAVDVKEKNQPLSERWPRWHDLEERDAFVVDELSVRRALEDFPTSGYFLIRDNPGGGRLFLAAVYEVAGCERIRLQRGGKGKWIIDLRNFRQVKHLDEVPRMILEDITAERWKRSECLSVREIEQV